jgi:ATP-binding cassette subfamily F protein 3
VLECSPSAADDGDAGAPSNRKAQKRAEAEARQRSYAQRKPLTDKLAKIEREMAALNTQRKSVEDWLASPSAYAEEEKETLKEHIAQQGDLAWQLARLETEWLEISEALEKVALEP